MRGPADSRTAATRYSPVTAFLWSTLEALRQLGGSASIQEIEAKAIELGPFSDAELRQLHRGGPQTEVSYRLAWARTHLKGYGAVENTRRGVWTITDLGRRVTEADMLTMQRPVVRHARSKPPAHDGSNERRNDESSVPAAPLLQESLFRTTDVGEWQDRLLGILQTMPPAAFERLCPRLLRESGFTKVDVTGRSGDGGIDGVGVLRVSLVSFQVFFQCKRYSGSVGPGAVRDFRGAMTGRGDKGLLITTGSFTPEAVREATRDGAPVLDLIDGPALCILLKETGLGVSARQVEEVEIASEWFRSL